MVHVIQIENIFSDLQIGEFFVIKDNIVGVMPMIKISEGYALALRTSQKYEIWQAYTIYPLSTVHRIPNPRCKIPAVNPNPNTTFGQLDIGNAFVIGLPTKIMVKINLEPRMANVEHGDMLPNAICFVYDVQNLYDNILKFDSLLEYASGTAVIEMDPVYIALTC